MRSWPWASTTTSRPSGVHVGAETSQAPPTRHRTCTWRGGPPAAGTVKAWHPAASLQRSNAISLPSGDQSGWSSVVPAGGWVTCCSLEPSVATVKRALCVCAWSRKRRKAIRPAGRPTLGLAALAVETVGLPLPQPTHRPASAAARTVAASDCDVPVASHACSLAVVDASRLARRTSQKRRNRPATCGYLRSWSSRYSGRSRFSETVRTCRWAAPSSVRSSRSCC